MQLQYRLCGCNCKTNNRRKEEIDTSILFIIQGSRALFTFWLSWLPSGSKVRSAHIHPGSYLVTQWSYFWGGKACCWGPLLCLLCSQAHLQIQARGLTTHCKALSTRPKTLPKKNLLVFCGSIKESELYGDFSAKLQYATGSLFSLIPTITNSNKWLNG